MADHLIRFGPESDLKMFVARGPRLEDEAGTNVCHRGPKCNLQEEQ